MATRPPSLGVRIGAGIAAVLLLAGLLLVFVSPDQQATTTTTQTSAPSTSEGPPPTVSGEDFERIAAGLSEVIDAAEAQRCPLIGAFDAFRELPAPADVEQVRTAVAVTAAMLRAVATSAAGDQPEVARTIDDAATALEAEAEAQAYAPEWLNTPPGNVALADPEFTAAFETYQQRTLELCAVDETGDGGSGPEEGTG